MFLALRERMENDEDGFTLIELLVVIIIIGILAAIAIPVFLNQRKKGWDAAAKSDLRNLAVAEESFYTNGTRYTAVTSAGELASEGFKNSPNVTVTAVLLSAVATKTTDAAAATGYCATGVHSQSGNNFYYNSLAGGFTTAACPA